MGTRIRFRHLRVTAHRGLAAVVALACTAVAVPLAVVAGSQPASAATAPCCIVAAGLYHTLTVRPDGTVWGWGYNAEGELGNPAGGPTPTQVSGLTSVTSVAAGWEHSLALKSNGTV